MLTSPPLSNQLADADADATGGTATFAKRPSDTRTPVCRFAPGDARDEVRKAKQEGWVGRWPPPLSSSAAGLVGECPPDPAAPATAGRPSAPPICLSVEPCAEG